MARYRLQPLIDWLRRVVSQPRDELNRWQRAVRFAYDLGRHGARQLREDRAPQMAAALSFRTLFGLLPVLVVGAVVAKAQMSPEEFNGKLHEGIDWIIDEFELGDVVVSGELAENGEQAAATQHFGDFLHQLAESVGQLNFSALGWVGFAIVIYAALGLMVTIEKSFNTIYRAPEGRNWVWRIVVYWTVLTVSPLIVALSIWVNGQFNEAISVVEQWQWLLVTLKVSWGFCATWFVIAAIYKLVTNTSVRLRTALIGALVTAVLLELGKQTLGVYVSRAVPVSILYGSLGLIPLFMFWVYIMWLVVLFGLEVSATLQMLGGRRLAEIEQRRRRTGVVDPASILLLMQYAAERFHDSRITLPREAAEFTGIEEETVRAMIERLVAAGHLHRLDRDDGAVTLARPPEQISADALIEIGFAMVDDVGADQRGSILRRLRDAQRQLAGQLTLAALTASTHTPATAGVDQAPGD